MRPIQVTLVALICGIAGCAGTGTVGYTASVTATTPDLLYVSPGVQVIADYDEPIFYTDDYYWRYYNGTWYRSSYYTGGWVYASPPRALLRIDRPSAYVRYRPHGYVSRRPVYRDHRSDRDRRPVVRDHRDRNVRPAPRTQVRPAPSQPSRPVVQRRPPAEDTRDRREQRDDRRDRERPIVRDHR